MISTTIRSGGSMKRTCTRGCNIGDIKTLQCMLIRFIQVTRLFGESIIGLITFLVRATGRTGVSIIELVWPHQGKHIARRRPSIKISYAYQYAARPILSGWARSTISLQRLLLLLVQELVLLACSQQYSR